MVYQEFMCFLRKYQLTGGGGGVFSIVLALALLLSCGSLA